MKNKEKDDLLSFNPAVFLNPNNNIISARDLVYVAMFVGIIILYLWLISVKDSYLRCDKTYNLCTVYEINHLYQIIEKDLPGPYDITSITTECTPQKNFNGIMTSNCGIYFSTKNKKEQVVSYGANKIKSDTNMLAIKYLLNNTKDKIIIYKLF